MEHYRDDFSTLYLGDCLEELKNIPNNSIDCIVTDPPYQLSSITKPRLDQVDEEGNSFNPFYRVQARKGFMGKEWDVLPPIEVWEECLRVLKPGAFAFIMTTSRQDSLCQILMDITQAGFRTDFSSIYWTYSSGFPKATNISKILDKRLGYEREVIENRKVTKNMAEMSKVNSNKQGYPKQPRLKDNYCTGEILDDTPISDQVKEFSGSFAGFQPKPAIEIILVVMKPLPEKTFTEQALNNGHGITWLDDCRIPYVDEKDNERKGNLDRSESREIYGFANNGNIKSGFRNNTGRFPANLLVSDDILNDGIDRKGVSGGGPKKYGGGGGFDDKLNRQVVKNYYNDAGSFSRYFDLDAWWKNKIKELPENIQKTFPFIIESKAPKSEKNKGLDFEKYKVGGGIQGTEDKSLKTGSGNERNNLNKNNHPCVKPIKLMSYLITLGSRKGDMVLDPFMGSGSTGIAAKLLNRKFIGIEREEDYIKIAEQRIKSVNCQQKLFD